MVSMLFACFMCKKRNGHSHGLVSKSAGLARNSLALEQCASLPLLGQNLNYPAFTINCNYLAFRQDREWHWIL